jgi:hypothetical protein
MRQVEYIVKREIKVDGKIIWNDEENFDYSEFIVDEENYIGKKLTDQEIIDSITEIY